MDNLSEMDMMQAMGFASFGKKEKPNLKKIEQAFNETRRSQPALPPPDPQPSSSSKPKEPENGKGKGKGKETQHSISPGAGTTDSVYGAAQKEPPALNGAVDDDDDVFGPLPPPQTGSDEDEDEDEGDEEADAALQSAVLPITHEIKLKDHLKVGVAVSKRKEDGRDPVDKRGFFKKMDGIFAGITALAFQFLSGRFCCKSLVRFLLQYLTPIFLCLSQTMPKKTAVALSLDPAGARLITGSRDGDVKFWDFNGMDASLRPFRSIEPVPGNPIRDLQFSITGDQFLMASGTAQAKLFDRDGLELGECVKGDPYIRDLRNTKGHISSLTCCRWHPNDKKVFLTASIDGTVRTWETETRRQKSVISVKSKVPGGRTAQTAGGFSPDGRIIAAAGQDGALRLWNSNGPYIKPTHTIENAHMSNSGASSILFSLDSHTVVTRGLDDTVKLFDLRNFTRPLLSTPPALPNIFEETNVVFSPDERLIVTGTSAVKKGGEVIPGRLIMLDRTTLQVRKEVEVFSSSAVSSLTKGNTASVARVLWHPRINQIVCGCGDASVRVMYDPNVSVRGAKMCVVKEKKQRAVDDVTFAGGIIITPHSLPMFREDQQPRTTKRRREKLLKDPVATKKPDQPLTGPGRGGKLGTNLSHHMMKTIMKDTTRDVDPREAILRHAKAAAENPYWINPAYNQTQPKPVFAERVYEDEDEEQRSNLKKRRQ